MFDIIMYLITGTIALWLVLVGLGVLMMPVYFWLLWRSD